MVAPSRPHRLDVVIRSKPGNPSTSTVYVLGTLSTPDQFFVGTRIEATSKALRFAKRAHAAVWFTVGGSGDFELVSTFRKHVRASTRSRDGESKDETKSDSGQGRVGWAFLGGG